MTIEERLSRLEQFQLAFCTLQMIHQNLVEHTPEERSALELLVATTLEQWKNELD